MPDDVTNTGVGPAVASGSGDSGGAVSSPAPSPEPQAPVAPAADPAPELTPDTFGWDKWDGSADALPEPVRGWGSKLAAHYERTSAQARDEAERARRIYESALEGREDPRLKELQEQLKELDAWKTRHGEVDSQYKALVKQLEDAAEAEARSEADAFKAANAWMFDGGEVQAKALELLNVGFDYTELPTVMSLPDQVRDRAVAILSDLTAKGATGVGAHALQLARAEVRVPDPSPSAKLVAGSQRESAAAVHAPAPKSILDGDLRDATERVVEKNLRLIRKS